MDLTGGLINAGFLGFNLWSVSCDLMGFAGGFQGC